MKFKKFFSSCIAGMMLITAFTTGAYAENTTELELNGGIPTKFVEVFRVENGVTYFPIRLAFNDFENQGYVVQVRPNVEEGNIRIAVRRTDSITGEIDRRLVFINWAEDITNDEEFQYGRLELYQYEQNENGENHLPTGNFRRPIALNNSIVFSVVDDNGGQRAFMSVEDLNNMVQFLIDDADYSVTIK